jgi:hypothetical protein
MQAMSMKKSKSKSGGNEQRARARQRKYAREERVVASMRCTKEAAWSGNHEE